MGVRRKEGEVEEKQERAGDPERPRERAMEHSTSFISLFYEIKQ